MCSSARMGAVLARWRAQGRARARHAAARFRASSGIFELFKMLIVRLLWAEFGPPEVNGGTTAELHTAGTWETVLRVKRELRK